MKDAASKSGCNLLTSLLLNSCLCPNGGNFVKNTATCVGQTDQASATEVYNTMQRKCQDSLTSLTVSLTEFLDWALPDLPIPLPVPLPSPNSPTTPTVPSSGGDDGGSGGGGGGGSDPAPPASQPTSPAGGNGGGSQPANGGSSTGSSAGGNAASPVVSNGDGTAATPKPVVSTIVVVNGGVTSSQVVTMLYATISGSVVPTATAYIGGGGGGKGGGGGGGNGGGDAGTGGPGYDPGNPGGIVFYGPGSGDLPTAAKVGIAVGVLVVVLLVALVLFLLWRGRRRESEHLRRLQETISAATLQHNPYGMGGAPPSYSTTAVHTIGGLHEADGAAPSIAELGGVSNLKRQLIGSTTKEQEAGSMTSRSSSPTLPLYQPPSQPPSADAVNEHRQELPVPPAELPALEFAYASPYPSTPPLGTVEMAPAGGATTTTTTEARRQSGAVLSPPPPSFEDVSKEQQERPRPQQRTLRLSQPPGPPPQQPPPPRPTMVAKELTDSPALIPASLATVDSKNIPKRPRLSIMPPSIKRVASPPLVSPMSPASRQGSLRMWAPGREPSLDDLVAGQPTPAKQQQAKKASVKEEKEGQ